MLPGITITGFSPTEIFRAGKTEQLEDTFDAVNETIQSRVRPTDFEYLVTIDCESRYDELLAYMSKIVRAMIANELIWVNGKKIDVMPEGSPAFIEPTEGYNQIPKIQYLMRLEIKEEIASRVTFVKTVTNNRNYTVRSN